MFTREGRDNVDPKIMQAAAEYFGELMGPGKRWHLDISFDPDDQFYEFTLYEYDGRTQLDSCNVAYDGKVFH